MRTWEKISYDTLFSCYVLELHGKFDRISCLISSKINSADLFLNYLPSGTSIKLIYKARFEKHFHD